MEGTALLYSPTLAATSGGEHGCKTTPLISLIVQCQATHQALVVCGCFASVLCAFFEGRFPPGITRMITRKGNPRICCH